MDGIKRVLEALFSWLLGKPVSRPADLPDAVPVRGESPCQSSRRWCREYRRAFSWCWRTSWPLW